MFVCICKALTEKTIAERIEAGATSVEAVRAEFALHDDDCCGGCEPMIEDLCEEVCGRMATASCPIAEAKRAGSFAATGYCAGRPRPVCYTE
ncbi:MAG: (2Fe-2S)-binding protein [Dehalococcoidia bacterium]|nr:(2Fe-2S)-binding protein [Dehalococcoidia bacterium]